MTQLFATFDPLPILTANANTADQNPTWPKASWEALRQAGVLTWCIPPAYGGQGRDKVTLLDGYERLASACLTTCFILSQREAACRRLRDQAQPELRQQLLPRLARGELFTTVGLSHLTTSRQHGQPAVRAEQDGDDFVLTGVVPWVTGASQAACLMTGGTLDDGRQLLAVVFTDQPGVKVAPPMDLMALAGSQTAEVHYKEVRVPPRQMLAGPVERVLMQGRSDTGGLETSCLALGLAGAAIEYLQREATLRPELGDAAQQFDAVRQSLRKQLLTQAEAEVRAAEAATLRAEANALVLRSTQAALTASKGAGFLKDHPAQRWARQAMFFLVWSCPRPAADATLAFLTPDECELTL